MFADRCLVGLGACLLLLAGCEEGGADPTSDAAVMQDASNTQDAGAEAGPMLDAAQGEGGTDAGSGDGCVPFVMPANCTIPENSALPSDLRCTGLYGRFEQRELACGVEGYAPAYALWSDAADKHRYVWMPPEGKLDATDPDEMTFPVGTKFWKEFRLPNGGRLLETRLLQKVETGWVYTAYVWSEDQTAATQNNDGVLNLYGSGHVVPNRDQCDECHRGRKDKILGWDALMLGAGAQGLTRDILVQGGRFMPGKELPSLSIPGDEVDRAALGYLHANCGVSCHNVSPRAKGGNSGLNLRLDVAMLGSVVQTPAVTTSVNRIPSTNEKHTGVELPPGTEPRGYMYDIRPGDPERSFVVARMKTRGGDGAMPALATNVVDEAGVAAVSAWIERMAPPAYPAPGPVPYDPSLDP